MSTLDHVDLATARDAGGVRMVLSGHVPSPWGEAAKGLFRLQGVPVRVVRFERDNAALSEWMRSHNVPVVLHEADPPRTGWAEIVALADRLGEPGSLLPTTIEQRAQTIGLIHELAGEGGLGWVARLSMIDASLTSDGARGFPLPIARYLAGKYGYAPGRAAGARERARDVGSALERALGAHDYFGGARPNALDVYSATFLTPLTVISEQDCPRLIPALRQAFATAREALADQVPPALFAHRTRMFERHLAWPIAI